MDVFERKDANLKRRHQQDDDLGPVLIGGLPPSSSPLSSAQVFEEWSSGLRVEWVDSEKAKANAFENSPMQVQEFSPPEKTWNASDAKNWRKIMESKSETNAFNLFRACGTFRDLGTDREFRLVVQSSGGGIHAVDIGTGHVFHLVQCQAMNNTGEGQALDDNRFWAKSIYHFIEALKFSMNLGGYDRICTWLFHQDARGCVLCMSLLNQHMQLVEGPHMQTFLLGGRLVA